MKRLLWAAACALLVGCGTAESSCDSESSEGGALCTPQGQVEATPPDGGGLQSSQERYTYPGCAESTTYCPRDGTFLCAVRGIEAKYDACTLDADCALVGFSGCLSYGQCPVRSVRADASEQFTLEVQSEIERYCASALCREAGSCALAPNSERAVCISGRCETSAS